MDSRMTGPIPLSDLRGIVRLIFWSREVTFPDPNNPAYSVSGPIHWERSRPPARLGRRSVPGFFSPLSRSRGAIDGGVQPNSPPPRWGNGGTTRPRRLGPRRRPGVWTGVLSSPSPTANLVGRSRRGAGTEIERASTSGAPALCPTFVAAQCLARFDLCPMSRQPRRLRTSASAPPGPSDRRQQRDVHVHLLLADGGRRAVRPGQHRLLHRRHRRGRHRPGRPLVHPGRDALQLRRAHRSTSKAARCSSAAACTGWSRRRWAGSSPSSRSRP